MIGKNQENEGGYSNVKKINWNFIIGGGSTPDKLRG